MNPVNNPNAAVVDANILVSITAKEGRTHIIAENAFKAYSQNGWIFFAPNVIVAEVLFALCQKRSAGILTEAEYDGAIEAFVDYMTIISPPNDEADLVKRAVKIGETYGCSRSSDSLYIALAEDLAKTKTVELFTLDRGMINQAAKNAVAVTVNVL